MFCTENDITKKRGVVFFLSAVISILCLIPGLSSASTPDNKEVSKKVGKLQVPFIVNNGQMDEKVGFYAKTFGGTVFVTKGGEIVYSLPEKGPEHDLKTKKEIKKDRTVKKELQSASLKGIALKESLLDGNITVVKGEKKSETNVSYFKGNDPSKYKSNISAYDIVSMGEVYNGIELKLRAYGNNMEKLFYVKPGADAGNIRLKMEGAKEMKVNDKGELELLTELGTISFTKPVAYQEVNGKRFEVAVEYVLNASSPQTDNLITEGKEVNDSKLSTPNSQHSQLMYGFKLGDYDKTKELVIDPLLASTFIGGSVRERAYALAVDSSGNVFVAGQSSSYDYPTTSGSYDTSLDGQGDVVVSKFNNNLTSLLASTFIGGSKGDYAYALAVDSSGNVFVGGDTSSPNYPTTPCAYDASPNDSGDIFISKFNNNLTSLLSSTVIGGLDSQFYALAIDAFGNVFVAGEAYSPNYPTTQGAYDTSFNGRSYHDMGITLYYSDIFVSKFSNNLTSLLASTFIGGGEVDQVTALAIDSSGNAFLTGYTMSPDYPTTSGAYNTSLIGWSDVFVSKFNNNLTSLLASTFIGGSYDDCAHAIALDSSGNVFTAGYTRSPDYPTTSGSYFNNYLSDFDAFISKLTNNLTSLISSTVIDGDDLDIPYALATDSFDNVFVAGETMSTNYPTTLGAFDTSHNGDNDVIVTKFNNNLTSILASTYIGGSSSDEVHALSIDASDNVFVAGWTYSADYPATEGVYDSSNSYRKAVVSKLDRNLSEGGTLANTCAARLYDTLTIQIPVATYGSKYYTAEMKYTTDMDFKLTRKTLFTYAIAYINCLSSAPTVAPDMSVHMPVIMFDGVSYWADFIYKGNMTWTMTQAGQN